MTWTSNASNDSAGQLAIATSLIAAERKPKVNIVHQALICPVGNLDLDRETKSEFEFFTGPLIDVALLRKAARLYLPQKKDNQNHLASPALLTKAEAAKLPQSTVIVSAIDPLRSDGLNLGEIFQQAGVDTVLLRGEGLIHDAFVLEATRQDPTCLAIVGLMEDRLKAALLPASSKPSSARPAKRTAETNAHKRKRARRT